MKILNINKIYYITGGAERFFFELQKLLEQKGHSVIPLAMRHPKNFKSKYEKYFVSQIQTDKIQFNWQGLRTVVRYFWSFEARRKIKKIINKEKLELAILHNIYHQISPSILPILKKNKIKTILIAHDYALLSPNYNMFVKGKIYDKICGKGFLRCVPDKCVKNNFLISLICGLETWFHHSILNIYKKNIDFVICPSEFILKMFLRAGWKEKKLIHLPYFIYSNYQKTLPKIVDDSKKDYILYFGRLSPEKGVDSLIQSMEILHNIRLKIAGIGPQEKKLKLQIKNLKLKNVELIGWQSGEELKKIITQAKFIVVPSIWYENYPLSILEAYSLGTPALVSNIGGLPEMISKNNENFLFKHGDSKDLAKKINYLWDNKNLLEEQIKLNFNFLKNKNNKEEYYKKLIKLV